MTIHKLLMVTDACGKCGVVANRSIELYVGMPGMEEVEVGFRLEWTHSPKVENGGCPGGDSGTAYGLSDCTSCEANLVYDVVVEQSVIVSAHQRPVAATWTPPVVVWEPKRVAPG